MNLGTSNRKQTLVAASLGVIALGACFYIYEELFATSGPAPAAVSTASTSTSAPQRSSTGPVAQHAARPVVTTLDPTLHMQAMLVSEAVTYSGAGRNIFSMQSAPPLVIPQPLANARPAPMPAPVPCPPNCPPPPPPPPIDLKFFGIKTSANGTLPQACLLHGDTVYLAAPGDVVLRRYKVLSIEPKSIRVQDLQNNNTQTLPLLSN